MKKQNISLTNAEWNLMECLWDASPRTGREVTEYLKKHVGWTRSTTLTMLRRMTDKGLIRCEDNEGIKIYSPLIKREDAVIKETDNFLNRVYKGSISLMMSTITKKLDLTKEEIEELYAILREAEVKEGEK
ncbi:BlaI/MecI/CopY family transcriptional regulator [Acetivibrio clariflavus]|uniref:Putative transcriptional regulator n=1 Tax=Acetivibrio clariflavus (strain DSM 19732 / NBRC 101661 / EBR45) TaxID=720554 RepID=G8LYM2_ACECE|nr:BlaI/MecI/CopY family transcriptional regulator [Acetivibrio clariflavus]AEV70010.1 putative transcriptional regulator [Acetivibrio clariflavus DSM 19732]HOQ38138.1 BlaI/MecI/CopY family transcriptional regulator [Acetivibrio sp.]